MLGIEEPMDIDGNEVVQIPWLVTSILQSFVYLLHNVYNFSCSQRSKLGAQIARKL